MERRTVLVAVASALSAGCLSDPGPTAEIRAVELENHRRDGPAEFTLRIEREGETVFERPVSGSGTYEVHVELAGDTASPGTDRLVSEGQSCLYLRFYRGSGGLTWDHTAYERCERRS